MIEEAFLTVTPRFSTRRLLEEDVEQAYAPAMRRALHG